MINVFCADTQTLVSKVICELAGKLDMDYFQKELTRAWKPLMKEMHVVMSDADS